MKRVNNFNEFLNEDRKYGTKEKQRFIEKWDVLFDELGIDDKKEQDRVVRAFDKLEGDNKTDTLVQVISLSLDKAKVGFSYNKLENFYQQHINESLNEDWYNKPNNYNDAFNRCIEQLDNILRTNVREYMIDQKDTIKSNNKEIKKIIASLEKMRNEINK